MKQLLLSLRICAYLFAGLATAAHADMTLSKSNSPAEAIASELSQLLQAERVALSNVGAADVSRLSRKPSQRKGPSFYSRDFLDGLPLVEGGKQWQCLAEALYFEARGEDVAGQFAVAEVILNRVDSGRFPDTVCKVVNQGTGQRFRCQFTYTCDGRAEDITEAKAWVRVSKIARLMLDGAPRGLTGGALYYHTSSVNPKWARKFHRTATIGDHEFYTEEKLAQQS